MALSARSTRAGPSRYASMVRPASIVSVIVPLTREYDCISAR
jgi:hypothetical protein